ncbi:antibiotic biosynthesis monooxygenase family protein [Achromobacter denitrificans]
MFVNLIYFPDIKEGKERAFLDWFDESNRRFSRFPGFVRRTLLKPQGTGQYVGLVEHASKNTFLAMHHSPVQADLRTQARDIFDGEPDPKFYEIVRGV